MAEVPLTLCPRDTARAPSARPPSTGPPGSDRGLGNLTPWPGSYPISRVNVQSEAGVGGWDPTCEPRRPACLPTSAGSPECSPETSSHAAVTMHRCHGSLSPGRPSERKTESRHRQGSRQEASPNTVHTKLEAHPGHASPPVVSRDPTALWPGGPRAGQRVGPRQAQLCPTRTRTSEAARHQHFLQVLTSPSPREKSVVC